MRAYIREIVAKQARQLFEGADAEMVLSWWIANEGRRPVVVVGSGFTRNAVYEVTREPVKAVDAPLWREVSDAFAQDLRIEDASGIDPLALAEFHRDGLGERRFYDMLRHLLPDDDLAPGEAHDALFNFDPEAIVTTNFLDTLLDRDSRCVPIFDDRDLARRIDKPGKIEVLYLHGHRSSPSTWVASRSQYEDLPRQIPMILARVRQLLSQHPVITVGFSLTDPDFHQVYRQISLDMTVTNPLGLALLGPASNGERTSEQESAQRRHWERLGLRIARVKGWDGFGEKIARFFTMTNPIEVEELKDIVGDPKRHFAERVERAKSAFEDPNVDKYVDTFRGWENAVWRVCIEREFEPSEHDEIQQKIRQYSDALFGGPSARDEVRVSIGGLGRTQAPDKEPVFKSRCFEGRIRKHWTLAWLADRWLETRRSSVEHFAAWLCYRVEHEYWDQRERHEGDVDIDIAELLGAVWRTIDDRADKTGGQPHRREAERQLRIAHQFLMKYGADEQARRVAEDIVALCGSVEPTQKEPPKRAHMKAAFRRMMNGEYEEAVKEYDKALGEATRTKDSFLRWLAAWGRHDAYWRAKQEIIEANREKTDEVREQERKQEKEYARAVKKHATVPDVKHWMDEAERRIADLRKKTVEEQRKAARDRQFERHGSDFSSTPHFAWRVFRDLESRDAPPGIQELYLQPLLDYDGFKVEKALELRLRFGVGGTQEWLDEKLDVREDSIAKACERDRDLVEVWHRAWTNPEVTNTTRMACIESMKPLLKVMSLDDAKLPIELLQREALPVIILNHRGWRVIGHDLAKAWREYVYNLRDKESYQAFRAFVETTTNQVAQDEIERRMGQLPWYVWMLLKIATPDEFVQWLCRRSEQVQRREGASYGTLEGVGNALLNVTANIGEIAVGLSTDSWNLIGAWCASALERSGGDAGDIGGLGSVLNLITIRSKQTRERGSDEVWRQVEDKACERLREAWRGVLPDSTKKLNASLAVSIFWCLAIIMDKPDGVRWKELAEEAWKTTDAQWDKFRAFITNNPFLLPRLGWFLATIIEQDFNGHRGEAGKKLLDIWSLSSSVHNAVPRILDKRFWNEEAWDKVVDKLREELGGASSQFSASWRMAISSLLRQVLLRNGREGLSDLEFLVDHVCLLVANEEAIVANHAAYTATFCAEVCTDDEHDRHRVALLERTLLAMASDTRLPVRQAAAYAGGRLPLTAKSQRIRECARRIKEALSTERYLLLYKQAQIGEAEGEARKERVGQSSNP